MHESFYANYVLLLPSLDVKLTTFCELLVAT